MKWTTPPPTPSPTSTSTAPPPRSTPPPGEHARFVNWTGDVSGIADPNTAPVTVTMDADRAIVGNFLQQYLFTLEQASQGGTADASETSGNYYDSGTEITLEATPDSGWRFDSWLVNGSPSEEDTLTLGEDTIVTPVFVRQYSLTVNTSGTGSGTTQVWRSTGFLQWEEVTLPGDNPFDKGAYFSITATPNDTSLFNEFQGGDSYYALNGVHYCTLTLDADTEITAVFDAAYALTLEVDGDGALVADPAPVAVASGPDRYAAGTQVTLWPYAESCTHFTHFTVDDGEDVETEMFEPLTVTMNQALTVTGYFAGMDLYGYFQEAIAFFYPEQPSDYFEDYDNNGIDGSTLQAVPNGTADAAEFEHLQDALCDEDSPLHDEAMEAFQTNLDIVYWMYDNAQSQDPEFWLPSSVVQSLAAYPTIDIYGIVLVFELLNKYIADNSLNVTLYSSGAPDSVFLLHPDEDADGDGFRNVDEWDYVRDVLFGPDAYIPDYYLYVWLYVFYVGDPDLFPSVSDPDEYEDREFVRLTLSVAGGEDDETPGTVSPAQGAYWLPVYRSGAAGESAPDECYNRIALHAEAAEGYMFHHWDGVGYSEEADTFYTLSQDADAVAVFMKLPEPGALDLASDLAWFLTQIGSAEDVDSFDGNGLYFTEDGEPVIEENGIPDLLEFALLERLYTQPEETLRRNKGATQPEIAWTWERNLAQAQYDLAGYSPRLHRIAAAYMTLGDSDSARMIVHVVNTAIAEMELLDWNNYDLSLSGYVGYDGDADWDGVPNKAEYEIAAADKAGAGQDPPSASEYGDSVMNVSLPGMDKYSDKRDAESVCAPGEPCACGCSDCVDSVTVTGYFFPSESDGKLVIRAKSGGTKCGKIEVTGESGPQSAAYPVGTELEAVYEEGPLYVFRYFTTNPGTLISVHEGPDVKRGTFMVTEDTSVSAFSSRCFTWLKDKPEPLFDGDYSITVTPGGTGMTIDGGDDTEGMDWLDDDELDYIESAAAAGWRYRYVGWRWGTNLSLKATTRNGPPDMALQWSTHDGYHYGGNCTVTLLGDKLCGNQLSPCNPMSRVTPVFRPTGPQHKYTSYTAVCDAPGVQAVSVGSRTVSASDGSWGILGGAKIEEGGNAVLALRLLHPAYRISHIDGFNYTEPCRGTPLHCFTGDRQPCPCACGYSWSAKYSIGGSVLAITHASDDEEEQHEFSFAVEEERNGKLKIECELEGGGGDDCFGYVEFVGGGASAKYPLDSDADCDGAVDYREVTLRAVPQPGYAFSHWDFGHGVDKGDAPGMTLAERAAARGLPETPVKSSTSQTVTVTITGLATNVTAVFTIPAIDNVTITSFPTITEPLPELEPLADADDFVFEVTGEDLECRELRPVIGTSLLNNWKEEVPNPLPGVTLGPGDYTIEYLNGKAYILVENAKLASLGLIPQTRDDGREENFSSDAFESTNYNDSEAFDDEAPGIQYAVARGAGNWAETSTTDQSGGGVVRPIPPWSAAHTRGANILAPQYGGVMKIWVRFGQDDTHRYDIAMIQNQADWVHISGHGSSATGVAAGLSPSNVDWQGDVKYAIIIACSVLDAWEGPDLPGKAWAQTGPKFLFGYHATAPSDALTWTSPIDHFYTAKIVSKFFFYKNKGEMLGPAWLQANADMAWQINNDYIPSLSLTSARNATAIDVEGNTCHHMEWNYEARKWEFISEEMNP